MSSNIATLHSWYLIGSNTTLFDAKTFIKNSEQNLMWQLVYNILLECMYSYNRDVICIHMNWTLYRNFIKPDFTIKERPSSTTDSRRIKVTWSCLSFLHCRSYFRSHVQYHTHSGWLEEPTRLSRKKIGDNYNTDDFFFFITCNKGYYLNCLPTLAITSLLSLALFRSQPCDIIYNCMLSDLTSVLFPGLIILSHPGLQACFLRPHLIEISSIMHDVMEYTWLVHLI